MKRLPKMWRKKNRQGKQVGNWIAKIAGEEVNLGTKDAELARRHLREAVEEGRRDFVDEIDQAAASLGDIAPAPAAAMPLASPAAPAAAPAAPAAPEPVAPAAPAALAALPPLPPEPPPPDPQDFADTAAAAGEAAGAGPEGLGGDAAGGAPPPDPQVTTEELAQLGVEVQVWIAAWRARSTVYSGFVPPPTPPEVRGPLAAQWNKILTYAGAAAVLPPWVTGLVFPGVALVTSTFAMAAGFAAIAEEQRVKAGAPPIVKDPPEAAAA